MEMIFLICFVLGLVLTVGSLLGGHMHLGHWHVGAHTCHGFGQGHAGAKGGTSWINGFSLAAFLCWAGGVGYLLQRTHSYAVLVVLLVALLAGSAGASLISLFLTRVLLRNERPLMPEDTEMRGVLARVSNRVSPGGTGEIVFSLNGTRRCSAARVESDLVLPRGTEVVVTSYQRGIAWVIPLHREEDALAVPLGHSVSR